MSLELLNTAATLLTVTIVAATAVAALIQLRHLRAGNQINAVIAIGTRFSDPTYQDAIDIVTRDLERALSDPLFRNYEIAAWRNLPPPKIDAQYLALHRATITVGNHFEELGTMVRNRIVDPKLFIDLWCGVVLGGWKRLASHTALGREVTRNDTLWENFEYLAVLSEDWINHSTTSYPKHLRRLPLHNQWPVPATETEE